MVACIAVLLVYPIIHFIPSRTFRIPAMLCMFIMVGIFGRSVWPKKSKVAINPLSHTTQVGNLHPDNAPSNDVAVLKPKRKVPVRAHVAQFESHIKGTDNTIPLSQTTISAPNGIAIGGGTVNNPTVNNNYRNPLPEIQVSPSLPITPRPRPTVQSSIQPGVPRMPAPDPSVYRPGASVTVILKGVFYNPSFIADCNVPCSLDKAWIVIGGGSSMVSISNEYDSIGNRSRTIAGVAYHVSQMFSGTVIKLEFRSLDDRQLIVTNVRPYAP